MNYQEEWDHTCKHLEWLNKQFVSLHNKPQKDWDAHDQYLAKEFREGARHTGEYRYYILSLARKDGVIIK